MENEVKSMDYEKAYKESFEAAKGLHDAGNALTKKQMEIVFPQLAESEDERIRKRIRLCLDECVHSDIIRDYERDECLAYIEKQKEPHFTKRNALFDKCVENCDPEIMKRVSDEVDEMLQKEQKPAEWSEEDEKMWKKTQKHLEDYIREFDPYHSKQGRDVGVCLSWLKSIRPVSKESLQSWKPSEEQMKALLNAEGYLRAGDQFDSAKKIAELYEQLKRL